MAGPARRPLRSPPAAARWRRRRALRQYKSAPPIGRQETVGQSRSAWLRGRGPAGAGRGARRAARLPQRPRQARGCGGDSRPQRRGRRCRWLRGPVGECAGSLLSGRPASEPCRQQRGSLLTWGWALRRAGCRQSPGLRSVGGPWEAWGERRGLAWPGGPDGRPGRGWPGARAGRAAGGELGGLCRWTCPAFPRLLSWRLAPRCTGRVLRNAWLASLVCRGSGRHLGGVLSRAGGWKYGCWLQEETAARKSQRSWATLLFKCMCVKHLHKPD